MISRFVQGITSAAAPVFIPGIIKQLFHERQAARATSLLGSIQALVPATAPMVGYMLLSIFEWNTSFKFLAVMTIVAALIVFVSGLPDNTCRYRRQGGFIILLQNPVYMRYALSQTLCIGGLMTFVFGAPTVIIFSMHGTLSDFIIMQIMNISAYILAANFSPGLVDQYGSEKIIVIGACIALSSGLALSLYGLINGVNTTLLAILFTPMGLALGIRGPAGFYKAIIVSGENNAIGVALIIFFTFMMTTLGSLATARFISYGLMPLATFVMLMQFFSLLVLIFLPKA